MVNGEKRQADRRQLCRKRNQAETVTCTAVEIIGAEMNKAEIEKMTAAKRATKKALVLIVEDNPTQQHLYKLIADEVQIIPCIVGTCAEGLEYAKFLNFDLILMDLQMPDLDGIECAKKIQEIEAERGNHSAIIAVTAHAMESDRLRCIEAGMDDYLSKPFSLSDLKAKIEHWAA